MQLTQALELVQTKRVYFGHQSVGNNIISGIKEISGSIAGSRLNMVSMKDALIPGTGFFMDSQIAENGYPKEKCDEFARNVGGPLKDRLDVALMKFCYADIDAATNVQEVFDYYVSTIEKLKKENPQVVFVHVTVPYTLRTPLWKRIAKAVLGREDRQGLANGMRNKYNELLFERYGQESIFDLARVESTFPDGRRCSFQQDGRNVYTMVEQLTFDGGHLNEIGRREAAAEMIRTLAAAVNAKNLRTETAAR